MTAELSVMNRNAIALAADSAVTISGDNGPKIFTSANKIFQLSKYRPIGIMIYQNTNFLGVPWEIIIKNYRSHIGKRKFPTLSGYADNFIKYLESKESDFSQEQKIEDYKNRIGNYYVGILKNILDIFSEETKKEGELSKEDVKNIIDETIDFYHQYWKSAPLIKYFKDNDKAEDKFRSDYKDLVVNLKGDIFDQLDITSAQSGKLTKIGLNLFKRFPNEPLTNNYTGVVIAGYGEDEIFPSLKSFTIGGLLDDTLRFKVDNDVSISTSTLSTVIPFAQGDMVHSFMSGIEPNFLSAIRQDLIDLVDEYPKTILDTIDNLKEDTKEKAEKKIGKAASKVFEDAFNKIIKFSDENYTQPIVGIVSALPTPELASMAESLVNLTNLRRKISMDAETVGGPIDVAVISKGDGFIWIKRKHYFNPELNHHFFDNYYLENKKDKEVNKNE